MSGLQLAQPLLEALYEAPADSTALNAAIVLYLTEAEHRRADLVQMVLTGLASVHEE